MQVTCDHCGSTNVLVQEKGLGNQFKHVCCECA